MNEIDDTANCLHPRNHGKRSILSNSWIPGIVLSVICIAAFFWALFFVPTYYRQQLRSCVAPYADSLTASQHVDIEHKILVYEQEVRSGNAQILGGIFLAVGLYLTWRRLGVAQEEIQAVHDQILISREQQITERFTRAVDHLSNSSVEVRLGGIYALERIAKDSSRDQSTIVEILCAYVRERCSIPHPFAPPNGPKTVREFISGPSTDIEAILTVLRRRRLSPDVQSTEHIDLSNIILEFADLSGLHIENGRLHGLHLSHCVLRGVKFHDSYLVGADLRDADLTEASFRGSNLRGAEFAGACFGKVDLSGASLSNARFVEASLDGRKITGPFLERQDLTVQNLAETYMKEHGLTEVGLRAPGGGEPILTRADLRGTDLREVRDLTWHQVRVSLIDEYTLLPIYLKP